MMMQKSLDGHSIHKVSLNWIPKWGNKERSRGKEVYEMMRLERKMRMSLFLGQWKVNVSPSFQRVTVSL